MAEYNITSTAFLPSGDTVVGQALVEISDKHIAMLRAAIAECETIDVGELNLEDDMPQLYDILKDACEVATAPAVEAYYLRLYFFNGEVPYDAESLMEDLWDAGIYNFDIGYDNDMYEEDESRAYDERYINNLTIFEEWLDEYINSLNDFELIDFMSEYMDFAMTELGDWEFTIEVPDCFKG